MGTKNLNRCSWAVTELGIAYHDNEWRAPVHDDRVFFEFLILEGAQAGLSWETILKTRENYRRAFAGFDPAKVARFDVRRIERLRADPGMVRNRLKIAAAVGNAKAFLKVQREFGSFDAFIWRFVGGRPKKNAWPSMKQLPAKSPHAPGPDASAKCKVPLQEPASPSRALNHPTNRCISRATRQVYEIAAALADWPCQAI